MIIRLFILIASITSDYFITDHDTSTSIHLNEIGAEELLGKNSLMYYSHKALVRYDAFFFLKHAQNGHTVEKNFAFFPVYSKMLKGFTKLMLMINPFVEE